MSEEIKPCPFCGCTEIRLNRGLYTCVNCFSMSNDWQSRPLEDAKDAEIARLEESVETAKKIVRNLTHSQRENKE